MSDSVGLVEFALSGSGNAFVKGTKVHLLVQLEGKSVELHLVDLFGNFGSSNDHLEGEAFSEGVSLRSAEAHVYLVLVSRGREATVDGEGNGELEGLVSSDVEGDLNSYWLNRHVGLFISMLGVVHAKEASLLPRPLGSVLDFDLSKLGLSGEDGHGVFVVVVDGLSAFVLPLSAAFAAHHSHELLAHSHHVLGGALFIGVSTHELLHHFSRVESVLRALGFHVSATFGV